MAQGQAQRDVMTILHRPAHRGRWMEARQIANELVGEWASQDQVARVRAALRRLEQDGEVARHGFMMAEWSSTRYPPVEAPAMVAAVAGELKRQGLL